MGGEKKCPDHIVCHQKDKGLDLNRQKGGALRGAQDHRRLPSNRKEALVMSQAPITGDAP